LAIARCELSAEELQAADVVIVVTDHDAFDGISSSATPGESSTRVHRLPRHPNVEYL